MNLHDPVLCCHGLTKRYGSTVALAGVDLAIRAGESVAVMGPSGSGKTTLLHCLAGILRADAGSVTLATGGGPVRVDQFREEERARLRRESFGFVFQQGLLLPELTAVENTTLPLMLAGLARREAEQQAASWLAHLGLAGLEGRRLGEMSGGQCQRVAIARSQVTGARVTFADEPTGALDQRTSADVLHALLEATSGRGRSLVMVTHDENVAAACSRVVRLEDGFVVHDSAPVQAPTPQPGVGAAPAPGEGSVRRDPLAVSR